MTENGIRLEHWSSGAARWTISVDADGNSLEDLTRTLETIQTIDARLVAAYPDVRGES